MIPMTLSDVASAMGVEHDARSDRIMVRRVITDSREVEEGDLFFAIRGKRFDGHRFIAEAISHGAAACVCERNWFQSSETETTDPSVSYLPTTNTVEALGLLATYYRRRVMPESTTVVAVTGSNGKTTTKSMLDHVLRPFLTGRCAPRSFNNQIGVPLTLLSCESEDQYVIVEIGTNARGEVASLAAMVSPHAAVITSIGQAHVAGLGDLKEIAAEKASLLSAVRSGGVAVVNRDCPQIRPYLRERIELRCITIGVHCGARLSITNISGDTHRTFFTLEGRYAVNLPMPGTHHATNGAAVFAMARWLGLAPQQILDRFQTFVPPPGRTRIHELDGVTLVDDSYNANPSSMRAAITALGDATNGRRIFVMGDMLELGTAAPGLHRQAVREALDAGIDLLVSVGEATAEAVRHHRLPTLERSTAGGWNESESIGDRPRPPATKALVCRDAASSCEALIGIVKPGDTIWIKGSRALGLEVLVGELRARLGPRAAVTSRKSGARLIRNGL